MLEQIMDYIHNYFVKVIYRGRFVIENGSISLPLINGQYFRILGSVMNDGVHVYPPESLSDEEFDGEIWALAVPPAVVSLSIDVENWSEKYGEVMNNPYQSESFGGYTYSKANGSGELSGSDWRKVFGSRLNAWRKINNDVVAPIVQVNASGGV